MYKIELHLHTKYVSICGQLDMHQLLDGYRDAGYSAIAVTDHFNRDTFRKLNMDPAGEGDHVKAFLDGFCRVREAAAPYGLTVYKGAELRFDGSNNDYLLFNYPDELLQNPERIFTMGLPAFSSLSREAGALLIQAHPFRYGCTPADRAFLDGVEILNMHPDHNSHNELAQIWSKELGLIKTSGSDCHKSHHIGRGGILADEIPADEANLVRLLRSGKYSLIGF